MTTRKKLEGRADRPLYPAHRSIIQARILPRPQGMEPIRIPDEIRETLTGIALDIFTDVSNSNRSFQEALLAIYLSGLHHGAASTS